MLVAAVGRAEMIRGDWIKPGAAVIDVGINRTDDGLRGDVDADEAAEVAGVAHPGARRRRADDHRLPAWPTRSARRAAPMPATSKGDRHRVT